MGPSDIAWFFPSAVMGWRNLGRNKLRTALAALGIVIGVVAIASLGIAGAAIQHQATANLGSLTDEISVTSGEDNDAGGVTEEQVEKIRRLVTDGQVVPQRNAFTRFSMRNRNVSARIVGVTQASQLYNATAGEAPARLQSGALVGNVTAERFGFELGDPIEFDGNLYRIRGFVTAETGLGDSGAEAIVLPVSAVGDQEYYDVVTIIADDGTAAAGITERLQAEFNRNGGERENVLQIQSFAGARENIGGFMNTLNLALLGIGSISLLVASVAILNVMLMSTIERRGEIGVLRAVGITRGEVLRMILSEAMFLGVIGGLVGVGVAVGVGYLIFDLVVGEPMLVFGPAAARHLLTAFGFAVVASLLSGAYPAWKAANDPPVESLRG